MSIEEIKRFFDPQSVAIVGASRKSDKFGSVILRNLQGLGYPGRLFAVNPHTSEILGVRSFPSLEAIPEGVDIAIIAVPAFVVPEVMADCARSRTKNVLIISSGFNEAGEAGRKRLEETLKTARRGGIRIIGPNTTGILNPKAKFTTTFTPLTGEIREGPVAFIAQTGMFAGVVLYYIITSERFGISRVAGLGNKSDVDDCDILEYLYEDEDTRVAMIYMEGLNDGRRFLQIARKFTRTKPLVVLKGGRTSAGAKAALSHTGSLAGQYSITEALFKQAGIILVHDLEEMIDFAKILAYQPVPRGARAGVASMSGGEGVMASDSVTEAGLVVANLASESSNYFQSLLPQWAVAGHPLDLEPLQETVGRSEAYRIGLEIILNDPNVDICLLVMSIVPAMDESIIDILAPLLLKRVKPVAVAVVGAKQQCENLATRLEEMEIPTYPTVARAAKSLAALYHYAQATNSGESKC